MMTDLTHTPNTVNFTFSQVALWEAKRYEHADDFRATMIVEYSSWEKFICYERYMVSDFAVGWGEYNVC
jgi:hypothetical protein